MPSKIFVNLPVTNLERSMSFFKKLGYEFNPQFTDETAACMVISPDIYAMLLTTDKFKTFTDKPVADAKKSCEVLIALSFDSRDAVTRAVETALANGGRRYAQPNDHGFMYQWGFEDPDGHVWECFWMDPAHVQQ